MQHKFMRYRELFPKWGVLLSSGQASTHSKFLAGVHKCTEEKGQVNPWRFKEIRNESMKQMKVKFPNLITLVNTRTVGEIYTKSNYEFILLQRYIAFSLFNHTAF